MFQGLKSRLAEETRKLQNAVNQVGISLPEKFGNLSQGVGPSQDKQAVSAKDIPGDEAARSSSSEPGYESPNLVDISLALNFQEADNESRRGGSVSPAVPVRPVHLRRDSGSSVSSFDSIFLPSQASGPGGMLLSDLESIADEDSISVCSTQLSESSSLEKVSMMLDKLSSQASLYRDKYKKVVESSVVEINFSKSELQALDAYRSCLAENEKLKTTIDLTRDRAVERIRQLRQRRMNETEDFQKVINELNAKVVAVERAGNEEAAKHKQKVKVLEDLLGRCKESITNYKSSIEQLTQENNLLRGKAAQEGKGDNGKANELASDEVDQQWQEQLKRMEEEWRKKMEDLEEEHNMRLAKIKQDMHETIEEKDSELESFHQRLNLALDELESSKMLIKESKACEETLENEKKELIAQLAAVKQAVVKAIVEEESKKHEAMKVEYEEMLREVRSQIDSKAEEAKADYEKMYQSKQAELERSLWEERQQMMLEVEEREMQKSAALLAKDEMIAELSVELEKLRTSFAELESRLANCSQLVVEQEERERRSLKDSEALLAKDETIGRQQERIDELNTTVSKLEEKLAAMAAIEDERNVLQESFRDDRLTMDNLSKKNADLEGRLESQTKALEALQNELKESQHQTSQLLFEKQQEVNTLNAKVTSLKMELESGRETWKAELSKATEERDEAKGNAQRLENECKELVASKEEMEEQSSRLVSEALQEAKEKAEKELQSIIDDLSQTNSTKMAELQEMVEKWKAEAASLQKRLDDRNAELADGHSEVEQWRKEKSNVDQKVKQLEAELEDEKKKAASLEERLEKLEIERARAAGELTSATKEMECLRLAKDDLHREHQKLLQETKATTEALQRANECIEDLKAKGLSEPKAKAAVSFVANLSQGYLSLLEKAATCIPEVEEFIDAPNCSPDERISENVGDAEGPGDSMEKCHYQLSSFVDGLTRGDKSLEDLLKESDLMNEAVNLVVESLDRLVSTCGLSGEAVKELRNGTKLLLEENEKLSSQVDTLSSIKESCQRSCSLFRASLSRLRSSSQDAELYKAFPVGENEFLRRIEQAEAECDDASVTCDLGAPFDSIISLIEWLLKKSLQNMQSQQKDFEVLNEEYHYLGKQMEEVTREKNRLSDLWSREEERKLTRQKNAGALFAEMENISKELAADMCRMNIPALEASLECMEGLVSVCGQMRQLEEPSPNHADFLNSIQLVFRTLLSRLECETANLSKELSNSEDNVRTIQALKARLAYDDEQRQVLVVALEKLFDSVAATFDQMQARLGSSESAIDSMRASLSELGSFLQQRHCLNEELTSLKARKENLEAEVTSKQKELEAARRSSVWGDWDQVELAAFRGSSPNEPPHDLRTGAHGAQDGQMPQAYEADRLRGEVPKVEVPSQGYAPPGAPNGIVAGQEENSLFRLDAQDEPSGRPHPSNADHNAVRSEGGEYTERKRFDSVDFHPLFAEPTEAEYLKNILYRYMTERELLGRESVTLAKAIAAVVKFSPSQTRLILLKEESRSATSW